MRRSLPSSARLLVAALAVQSASCARTPGPPAGVPASRSGRTASVLACDEVRSVTGVSSAYDLVRRLRPTWLETRGQISIYNEPGMGLIIDGRKMDAVDQLQDVPARAVVRIERLRAEEVRSFGQFPQGAISVTTGSCSEG